MIDTNLAVLLAERGLSISDLSSAIGVSRQTLTTFTDDTAGGIRFATVNKICHYLKITPAELFNYLPYDYSFNSGEYYNAFDPESRLGSNRPDGYSTYEDEYCEEYFDEDYTKVVVSTNIRIESALTHAEHNLIASANILIEDFHPTTRMSGEIVLGERSGTS